MEWQHQDTRWEQVAAAEPPSSPASLGCTEAMVSEAALGRRPLASLEPCPGQGRVSRWGVMQDAPFLGPDPVLDWTV
jgi:hypothetical protein